MSLPTTYTAPPGETETTVDLTDLAGLIAERASLVLERERLAEQIEAITALIQDRMGQAQVGLVAGRALVTWKTHVRTALDSARLKRELPDIWAEYGKATSVRRFVVADESEPA